MSFGRKMKNAVACGVGTAGAFVVPAMVLATETTPAVDLSGVEPDMTNVATLAASIASALMVLWGVRKIIKLVNHS